MIRKLFKRKQVLPPFDLGIIQADMHSHLIPGIDDGSKSMDETIAMLAKFQSLGFKKIITTPHIMADCYPNSSENILSGLQEVRKTAKELGLTIEIEAAAEYYFDETLIEKTKSKDLLSFGDHYVLVEFAFVGFPSHENELFFEMIGAGYKPVLAHFERYAAFHGSIEKAIEYKSRGAFIQLNLNSLTGHYGPQVKKQAERLIDAELVDFVGSDCHRIQHLLLLEENLNLPYIHKLAQLELKNQTL